MNKAIGTTTAAALLVAGSLLAPGTATAAESAYCALGVGAVTATGDHRTHSVIATVPPTASSDFMGHDIYADGLAKASSSMALREVGFGSTIVNGYVILGDGLYSTGYTAENGQISPGPTTRRIGGGWGSFVALEEAEYQDPTEAGISRWNTYGLRGDGVLFRWTLDTKGVWRNRVSAPGFAAVKSMALISKSRTYDTFLANTRGGALYTIHIPTTAPLQPVVKLVRRSTWQGFEALLAQRCGLYGTLLLGIDKDTRSAYLYAVGHANGLSTVIESRGKVPLSFIDPVYFRWKDPGAPLTGE